MIGVIVRGGMVVVVVVRAWGVIASSVDFSL